MPKIDTSTEVAVIGAGSIGIAVAYYLVRKHGCRNIVLVDPRDPMQNLDGGARYLLMQLGTFRSSTLALAAYNAGPGAVQKYGGVPPYRETRNYVVTILSHHARLMATK